MQKKINIQNKRAKFEYKFIEEYTAGIVLTGTEIKSLRNSKASISESFCEFNQNGELFTVNMQIEEYRFGTRFNHRPKAQRKLLLNKKELKKLHKEVKINGVTIVTINLFDLRWQYPNDMTDNLTFDTNKIPITIQSQIPPSPSARDPSAWPSLL